MLTDSNSIFIRFLCETQEFSITTRSNDIQDKLQYGKTYQNSSLGTLYYLI